MYLFALLVYLALFSIVRFVNSLSIVHVSGWHWFAIIPALCILSILIVTFGAYLIDTHYPQAKRRLRNIASTRGIKWLCGLTVLAILGGVVFGVVRPGTMPKPLTFGYILPILVISVLNALGVERRLKRLDIDEEPGKAVLPRFPAASPPKEEIVKRFEWEYGKEKQLLELVIRRSLYEALIGRERIRDKKRWAEDYVVDGVAGEIRELAHKLFNMGMSFGADEVRFALAFVQGAVRYEREETEYPRYPVETLAEGVGDCEDFAILAAAVLKCMGYDVALLFVPNHCALGVAGVEGLPGVYASYEGRRYYYCEMTGKGWEIGQTPPEYDKSKVEVFPVPSLKVKIDIENTDAA